MILGLMSLLGLFLDLRRTLKNKFLCYQISIHFVFDFFYLIKINLDVDVAFFNVKIDFFNYYFNVLSATPAFFVSWMTVRT